MFEVYTMHTEEQQVKLCCCFHLLCVMLAFLYTKVLLSYCTSTNKLH